MSDLIDGLRAARDRVAAKKLGLRFVPRRLNLAGLYNEEHPVGPEAGWPGWTSAVDHVWGRAWAGLAEATSLPLRLS